MENNTIEYGDELLSDSEDLEELIRSAEEIIRGYQDQNRNKELFKNNILREVAETLSTAEQNNIDISDTHIERVAPVQFVRDDNSPITQNNISTPEQNSQSNNDDDDDDVVYVSSAPGRMPSFIDLCSPMVESIGPRCRRRPAVDDHTEIDIIPCKKQELSSPSQSSSSNLNTSSSEEVLIIKCPVCMENLKKKNPTTTVCGHIFCEKCIKEALKVTKKCPLCNKKLGPKMIHRIYF